MKTILDHVKDSIDGGMPAVLRMNDEGAPGVLFIDEEMEFIPFADLNYNSAIGYFRISAHPNAKRECANEPVTGRNLNTGAVGRRWAVADARVTGYVPEDDKDALLRLASTQSEAVRVAVDIALHPLQQYEDASLIRLADPLPCGIRAENGSCGKPAQAAYVYRLNHPTLPGHFVLLPICKDCATAAAERYK